MSEYAAWAKHHATIFGIYDEKEVVTLLSWEHVLGATPAELTDATNFLAKNQGMISSFKGKMSGHLDALIARLNDQRAQQSSQDQREREHDFGTCETCGSSGWVQVPHPKCIREGQWVPLAKARAGASYYTCVVLCSCALGRWTGGRRKPGPNGEQALTLESYSARNPGWRRQLQDRYDQERAERNALAELQPITPQIQRLDGTINRLVEGWKEKYAAERNGL